MTIEVIRDIWELYGVHSNPFSTAPILVKGGIIPVECFIGRNDQILQLGRIIGSKGGSRCLIYGEVGVGKTSFVNVVRRFAVDKGHFSPFKEIAFQSDWDSNELILNTLGGVFTTIKLSNKKILNDETYSKLEALIDVGYNDKNYSVDVFGSGVGYGKSRKTTSRIISSTLAVFFADICKEIIEKTGNEIIIHYNNIELLSEKQIKTLFENLRDFFQIEGVHFVFVGSLTVKGYFQSMPRFSSIMTDSINIDTLTFEEIKEIITKRFETMKIEGLEYVIPFTDDCLKVLYDLWGGNIRHILNSLSTAIQEQTTEKAEILDENTLSKTLKSVLQKRYYSQIATPRAKDVLMEIIKRDDVTNKALSDKLELPRSNISQYIRDLERVGCVYLKRQTGKDKFWSADPTLKWELLKESKHVQKTIQAFD